MLDLTNGARAPELSNLLRIVMIENKVPTWRALPFIPVEAKGETDRLHSRPQTVHEI